MLQSSRSELRQRLIDSTIAVVAKDGIDRATTKAISKQAGVNEVYIYRLFEDKYQLFQVIYDMLDDEMIGCLTKNLSVINTTDIPVNQKAWLFFSNCWDFLLGNKEKCSYFIKYYYSDFYDNYPVALRQKKYEGVVGELAKLIKDPAFAGRMLDHTFEVAFSTVIKVIRGELPEDETTARELYDFLVGSLEKYFLGN